jgi:hypothetical protein
VRTAETALARRDVPNSVPAGAQWTALPQTATPAPLYRALGALALLLAAGFAMRGTRSRATAPLA